MVFILFFNYLLKYFLYSLCILFTKNFGILRTIWFLVQMELNEIEIFNEIFELKSTNLSENKIEIEKENKSYTSNHIPSIQKLHIQILYIVCEKNQVHCGSLHKHFIHKFNQIKLKSFLSWAVSYIDDRKKI